MVGKEGSRQAYSHSAGSFTPDCFGLADPGASGESINASLKQRIQWHEEHHRQCACREMPQPSVRTSKGESVNVHKTAHDSPALMTHFSATPDYCQTLAGKFY
jgi:hypothetical protein